MNKGTVKLKKAVGLLNQKGLGGLIIYSNGVCHIKTPNYLQYFAGFRPLGANNAMLISKSGHVSILVEPPWDSYRVSRKTGVDDVRGSVDFTRDLSSIMHEANITGSVGVAGSQEMTEDLHVSISSEAKVVLVDDIIEEVGRKKTKEEIDIVRKAGRIADIGFQAFLEHARVGIREYELAAEIEFAMRMAGADDNLGLVGSEKHNLEMHWPRDKRLTEGDILLAEITPICDGQFVQLCRTIILGSPSPVLTEKYDMLLKALEQSLKTMRAGAPASLISRTMDRIISEAGYAEYCRPPYMSIRGHGCGVGSSALARAINDDTGVVNLEAQQVVAVHPNQYLPETGHLACGETVLITDTGVERLAQTETKLYVKEL